MIFWEKIDFALSGLEEESAIHYIGRCPTLLIYGFQPFLFIAFLMQIIIFIFISFFYLFTHSSTDS
jgi:hypothetical protein